VFPVRYELNLYISYAEESRPPCGLVVRVPGYRSRVSGSIPVATRSSEKKKGLERGRLSLVSTTEELLGRKSRGSGLGSRDYGRMDPPR
jgi:hypothetical protein